MEGYARNKNELWISERRKGLAWWAVRGSRLGGTVPGTDVEGAGRKESSKITQDSHTGQVKKAEAAYTR